jgi:Ca-activated chloride channel family protein
MNISFAYSLVLAIGLPLVAVVMWWHIFRRKVVAYQFPLTRLFNLQELQTKNGTWRRPLLYFLRGTILVLLVLAIARPQTPDERSKVPTEGVAIALVLDVSGSMESFDDLNTKKSRFRTAQEEAIRFINNRPHDLFGLVLFGALAVSRCPLTADKKIVTDIIRDTRIGLINPQGTVLAMGIAMAVNRLRNAEAKSKIMVVLTDGEPSPHDMRPDDALALAKKVGIKIYTIGIGSDAGGYMQHPFGGVMQVQTPLNEELLSYFAQETGGAFFKATNQRELAAIYDHINALEKSSHDAPVYTNYYEWYAPLLLLVVILLLIECCMSCWWGVVI